MSRPGLAIAAVAIFIALTVANLMYYSNRMRQLNDVPLSTSTLGGDAYQIGSRAARDARTTCWTVEGVLVVVCGAAFLFALGSKKGTAP